MQEQVLFRLFLIMWLVGVPTSLGVIAVFAFNQEFFAVRREVRNGMYSPFAYLLASTAIQLPMMLILAAGAISISVSGRGGAGRAGRQVPWATKNGRDPTVDVGGSPERSPAPHPQLSLRRGRRRR